MKEIIHRAIVEKHSQVQDWFWPLGEKLQIPFYSSFDIRDSGSKVGAVDANIFPAGFNNICQADKEHSVELARDYVADHYGSGVRNILVIAEEHTANAHYWENVKTILKILEEAGFKVRVAVPEDRFTEPFMVQPFHGGEIQVDISRQAEPHVLGDFKADLILTNNDFSKSYSNWTQSLKMPINPSPELGWYQRRKHHFFEHYNQVAGEFGKVLGVDPRTFQVLTRKVESFDVGDEASRQSVAAVVEEMLSQLKQDYKEQGIQSEPYLYVKNNSGTYGLGVTEVSSPDDILNWNYKTKKKMKATKGGGGIQEVIVQEGIPTLVRSGEDTAEPAIYMLGCHLAGGFLRTHERKDERQSLNSPGAVYRRLCVSDLEIDVEGKPLENVYGWIAKLGLLAIGLETQAMGIVYPDYQVKNCRV